MNLREIVSVTLILFSIIDTLGNLPVIIGMKEQGKVIEAGKATISAGVLMVAFLFGGESILNLLGVDVESFAIAGAIVIFIMGLEMILGVTIFKESLHSKSTSIVPIAFPMIAGSGTLTTILSLRAEYSVQNIAIGIAVNLVLVYLSLRSSGWIQRKIGQGGAEVLRKVFGIILLAIAVKLFRKNLGI
ncbi:MAG: MarC family protein [Saprospirales bacterium]|nr:MarC family protein [Saprospirales bacterium]MBK8492072.1 MarC family protein [Saprospirales bacterium]